MSANPNPNKQVIYVDVDDEITAIIDKMNASSARVVALVLPKRATVFQSVVNMKLLKRRADSAKKNLVLITSEAGLMPLAGLAGIHVAPTLQSKPEIPEAAVSQVEDGDDGEETASLAEDFSTEQNAKTPIGTLASAGGGSRLNGADSAVGPDNTRGGSKPKPPVAAQSPAARSLAAAKDKKPKIPNFLRFRKRFMLAGLVLVLLAVGWYFAYFVMPKATVTIKTNSSDIEARLAMTLDTAAGQVDVANMVVPAQTKQEQKSSTQAVPATGQENKGQKATGSVNMVASVCGTPSTPADVPAGTGVSANDQTFITQKNASFSFDGISDGCIRFRANDITIAAQKGGSAYNITSADFAVAGRSDVRAGGSASGGTDNNVKVVQQSDVDEAKKKLDSDQDETAIKRQLQERLEEDGLYALTATFFASEPNISTSSNVGEEAEEVTVTQSVTYTMFGVKKDDLSKLVAENLKDKIDESKQSILDDGLSDARITLQTPGAGPQLKVDAALTATTGPKIDTDALRQEIVGLKSGEVKDRIQGVPGVNGVEVKYSPFWVTKAPKAEKITIVFEKSSAPEGSADGQ